MPQLTHDPQTLKTAALLTCYGFDLRGLTPIKTLEQWLESYPILWIRLAVVEALYQGRYKAVSVEQLLKFWLKRGHPLFHFNHEFECLISHNLPKILLQPLYLKDEPVTTWVPHPLPTIPEFRKTTLPSLDSSLKTAIAEFIPPRREQPPELTNLDSLLPLEKEGEIVKTTESSPDLATLEQLDWAESPVELSSAQNLPLGQRTIDQFSPQRERSPWFDKLKTVLKQELAQTAT